MGTAAKADRWADGKVPSSAMTSTRLHNPVAASTTAPPVVPDLIIGRPVLMAVETLVSQAFANHAAECLVAS